MNIIKATLEEKLQTVQATKQELVNKINAMQVEAAKHMFAKVLLEHDAVTIKVAYESLQFLVDNKSILSIEQKTAWDKTRRSFYLNTYATWVNNDFEMQRIIFNGAIAETIQTAGGLEVLGCIFDAGEEVEAEEFKMQDTIYQLEKELNVIKVKEAQQKEAEIKQALLAKTKIEFVETKRIYYGKSRWDYQSFVKSVQVVEIGKRGKVMVNMVIEVDQENERVSQYEMKLDSLVMYCKHAD
jgi:hypothetical protein